MRLTNDEFISRCVATHGNTYDYLKTIYTNARSKITVIYKEHGEFTVNESAGERAIRVWLDNN